MINGTEYLITGYMTTYMTFRTSPLVSVGHGTDIITGMLIKFILCFTSCVRTVGYGNNLCMLFRYSDGKDGVLSLKCNTLKDKVKLNHSTAGK